MGRPGGNPLDFAVDQAVRYKPGVGTYGYEDITEADGRIPAVVIGHTPQMVRIRFAFPKTALLNARTIERAVAAESLVTVPSTEAAHA